MDQYMFVQSADEALLCVRCGYNLFGIPHDSRCPECGTAVAHTISAWKWSRYHFAPEACWRAIRWGIVGLVGWCVMAVIMYLEPRSWTDPILFGGFLGLMAVCGSASDLLHRDCRRTWSTASHVRKRAALILLCMNTFVLFGGLAASLLLPVLL